MSISPYGSSSASLTPRRQRALLAAVMSGLLLAMLDQTIVGTALPRIVEELGGSSLYIWVVTAYLVPATVSLPVYARLSDRYGRRALLLIGMVLFLLGSALSASAQRHASAHRLPRAAGTRRGRAGRPVVHPRRRSVRRPAKRGAAGRAGRPDGGRVHRRPDDRRLPHRLCRLALDVPRQPPDRARRARRHRPRAAGGGRPQREQGEPDRLRRDRAADARRRPAARRA